MKLTLTSIEELWSCELDLFLSHRFTGSREQLIAYLEETHKLAKEVDKLLGLEEADFDHASSSSFPEYSWDEWNKTLGDCDNESYVCGFVTDHDGAYVEDGIWRSDEWAGGAASTTIHPALRFGTGGVKVEAYNNEEPDASIEIQLDVLRNEILTCLRKPQNWKTALADGGTWKFEASVISESYSTC
jgi:hypothetical protein